MKESAQPRFGKGSAHYECQGRVCYFLYDWACFRLVRVESRLHLLVGPRSALNEVMCPVGRDEGRLEALHLTQLHHCKAALLPLSVYKETSEVHAGRSPPRDAHGGARWGEGKPTVFALCRCEQLMDPEDARLCAQRLDPPRDFLSGRLGRLHGGSVTFRDCMDEGAKTERCVGGIAHLGHCFFFEHNRGPGPPPPRPRPSSNRPVVGKEEGACQALRRAVA